MQLHSLRISLKFPLSRKKLVSYSNNKHAMIYYLLTISFHLVIVTPSGTSPTRSGVQVAVIAGTVGAAAPLLFILFCITFIACLFRQHYLKSKLLYCSIEG